MGVFVLRAMPVLNREPTAHNDASDSNNLSARNSMKDSSEDLRAKK